jgi:flagellar biosynthesis/type III secretory pathway protein FliH
MSTSEPRQPELLDLRAKLPASPARGFVEQAQFERLSTAPPRTPSRDEIFQSGVAEGERLGRSAAMKELEPVIAELREIGRALAGVREQRLAAVEAELIEVATELARRILHGELAQPRDAVVRMARACVEEAADEGALVLRAAAADVELLRTHAAELAHDLAEGSITIQADPALEAGGVVLESRTRCYDGRPARVLNAARARAGEETTR